MARTLLLGPKNAADGWKIPPPIAAVVTTAEWLAMTLGWFHLDFSHRNVVTMVTRVLGLVVADFPNTSEQARVYPPDTL